jgi:aryl-alcohol dehydrogenase-like predicted oxidoreductase
MKDKKSKIAIGTVQFGMDYGISNATGRTPKSEVSEILNLAHFNGIQTLDTAQGYGKSEVVMGEVGVQDFQVISKLSPAELKKETAETLTLRSLKATGLNKFYGMLFHNAESAMQNPSTIHDLQVLKAKNVISKWGYSLYTPQELEELLDKYELPDLVQVPYNHLDNRFEPILKELHQKGVEVHTRSTFLQGLFFMNPIGLSEFFNPVKGYLTALQENVDTSLSIAPALLNWVIDKSFIDKVVIGVNTKAQLESNIKGLESSSICDLPEWISVPNEILMPNLWPKN